MPGPLVLIVPLLAQNAKAQPAQSDGFLQMAIMLLPMVFLFYFLILRPQQQQERKRRAMIDAIKKNDRVLTGSGIYGTVVSIDPGSDRVVLRVDDDRGVRLTFTRASIARVVEETADAKDAPAKDAKEKA